MLGKVYKILFWSINILIFANKVLFFLQNPTSMTVIQSVRLVAGNDTEQALLQNNSIAW
jgi:hypothetical protein